MAHAVHQQLAQLADDRRGVVLRAGRRAGVDEHHVVVFERLEIRARGASAVVGRDRAAAWARRPTRGPGRPASSELNSTMSPGLTFVPGSTSSVPVGKTATAVAADLEVRCGRTRPARPGRPASAACLSGSTSSVATMSSPIARTCCHGATGAMISIPPRRSSWTCSTMMTAFMPAAAGRRCRPTRRAGRRAAGSAPSRLAPLVSSARTATPSMAAA